MTPEDKHKEKQRQWRENKNRWRRRQLALDPTVVKEYDRRGRIRKRNAQIAKAGRPIPEVCDSCHFPPNEGRTLVWDHCHATGDFRGWLCHHCNTAAGSLKDDPLLCYALAHYLKTHGRT